MADLQKYDATQIESKIDEYDLDEKQIEKIEDLLRTMKNSPDALGELEQEWGLDSVEYVNINHGSVTKNNACPNDSKEGDIFSDPSGKLLYERRRPDQTWKFIVAFGFLSRIRFETDGKQMCTSMDGEWGSQGIKCKNCVDYPGQNKRTDCNNQLNFIAIPFELDDIYQIRFKKSNYRQGDSIKDALAKASGPGYNIAFELSTQTKSARVNGQDREWKAYEVSTIQEDPPKEALAVAEFINNEYQKARDIAIKERNERMKSRDEAASDVADEIDVDEDDDIEDVDEGFESTM